TISIKFSSDNPYLAQQQTQNSHVDTQLIAGNIDASVETQNWKKDSRTAIENVDQTTTEIRPTPKDNCFVDHEVPHLNKQNLVKDDNMIMEVDSNVTTSEQKMGDQQKYIHNNPYTALVDENVLQDDNYNSIRGTDNNNDYVPEIEEETNRNIASKEGNKIETESNITIEGDEVTEQRETRQMSYSEALGGHNGKRREVTQRLDNGWSEE
ncbi:15136_t:CDS:1, partial [Gigaspora rosea]